MGSYFPYSFLANNTSIENVDIGHGKTETICSFEFLDLIFLCD